MTIRDVFDQIEKMKRQYTDKYVVVDASRPELARFRDVVGRVKTVNMSGRALVEFVDYHLNIGWYDIDPEFLKVVDKPPPKAAKPEAKKPAAKAEAKPSGREAASGEAAASGARRAKPSVADILAAARGGKAPPASAGCSGEGEAGSGSRSPTSRAAAETGQSRSLEDERRRHAGRGARRRSAAAQAPRPREAASGSRQPVEEEAALSSASCEAPAAARGSLRRSQARSTNRKCRSTDMLAYCREHDAK